jgi:hypothetical protein
MPGYASDVMEGYHGGYDSDEVSLNYEDDGVDLPEMDMFYCASSARYPREYSD